MESPLCTPSKPLASQHADFTQHQEFYTPNGILRPSKKAFTGQKTSAPPLLVPGDRARSPHMTLDALSKGIDSANRKAAITAAMLKSFATKTDNFASGFESPEEQAIAEEICTVVARALAGYYNNTSSSPSPTENKTYASVASTGPSPQYHKAKPNKATFTAKPAQQTKTSRDSLRVLVHVPHNTSLGQKPHPFALRQALVNAISGLEAAKILDVSPTRTGWAIIPLDLATQDLLLSSNSRDAILQVFNGTGIVKPQKWYTYAVPGLPSGFYGPLGFVQVTPELVRQEVETQTRTVPVKAEMSKHGADSQTGKATWIVSFTKLIGPFYIFNTYNKAHLIKKPYRLTHHLGGCLGWCNPLKCTREQRCIKCGIEVKQHQGEFGENCTNPAKCANCCSNQPAGHANCPAAPVVKNGKYIPLSYKALKAVRHQTRAAITAATAASSKRSFTPAGTPSPQCYGSPDTTSSSTLGGATIQDPGSQPQVPKGKRVSDYENAVINKARNKTGTPGALPKRKRTLPGAYNLKALSASSVKPSSNCYASLSPSPSRNSEADDLEMETTTTSQPNLSEDEEEDANAMQEE